VFFPAKQIADSFTRLKNLKRFLNFLGSRTFKNGRETSASQPGVFFRFISDLEISFVNLFLSVVLIVCLSTDF
jgi:hypothetical protein